MTQTLMNFAARDRAIKRVESANTAKVNRAVDQVGKVAPLLREFTTDDLFPDPDAWGFTDSRAIGAVMRRAQRLGYIVPTDMVRNSNRSKCHNRPKRVWVVANGKA